MVDAHAARSGLCIVGFYQVGGVRVQHEQSALDIS